MFNILDHLDKLTVLKELSSELVCECPVCNGQRLTISRSSSAYSCWTTECPAADIREAIAPLGYNRQQTQRQEKRLKPAIVTGKVELARLSNPVKANTASETWYEYDQACRVHRYYEGDQKYTIPYCHGQRGKGKRMWSPYRIQEVQGVRRGAWVLIVEGEKCVEYARELGAVALTWQGSSWSLADFAMTIMMLRSQGVAGICYYPDLDIPGFRKAYKLWRACAIPTLHKFPIVVLDPLQVWDKCHEGGDIADWCKSGLASVPHLEAVANKQVAEGVSLVEEQRFLPF